MLRVNDGRSADTDPIPVRSEQSYSWSFGDGGAGTPLDLRQLFRLLTWHARLIGGVALAAVTLTIILLVVVPARYTATAVVLLDPRQPRITTSEQVLSGIGDDAAAVESQVELVQSQVLARKVIGQLGLDSDPEFNTPSLIEDIKSWLGFDTTSAERRANQLLSRFENSLSVRRRGLTYILEIQFSSKDPKKAAKIANALAAAYIDSQQELKSDLAKDVSLWLDKRLEALRKRALKSEKAVADYKAEHHIVDVTQGNKLVARRMEDVSKELAVAQSRKAEVGGRLKEVQAAAKRSNAAAALAEILQSQTMGALRSQYAIAARLEAEYRAIYGDQHPSLVAAREQLAELRSQIEQEVARFVDGLRTDYEAASKQQASLEAELAALRKQAQDLDEASVPLAALTREAEADRALLKQYLGRLKETSDEETLRFTDARVVSPALAPLKPGRPGALLLLLAAAVVGAVCAVGLALVGEHMRRGLRTPDDVEQALGLPWLGTVPNVKEQRGWFGILSWWQGHARKEQVALATSEYMRTVSAIATRLRRSATWQSEVLIVASALPGEGKSTFACNLARASAACGVRTLLIDGDCYSGEITRMFGMAGPGFRELCEGYGESWDVAMNDASSGLYVIGTGDARKGQFHHFDEVAVAAVLRDFRQYFDVIVVDSPAILPTGGRLIECADRIVMIAEWDCTDRAAVADALAMMGPHEVNVVGVVLNKASLKWWRLLDQRKYDHERYAAGLTELSLPSAP